MLQLFSFCFVTFHFRLYLSCTWMMAQLAACIYRAWACYLQPKTSYSMRFLKACFADLFYAILWNFMNRRLNFHWGVLYTRVLISLFIKCLLFVLQIAYSACPSCYGRTVASCACISAEFCEAQHRLTPRWSLCDYCSDKLPCSGWGKDMREILPTVALFSTSKSQKYKTSSAF